MAGYYDEETGAFVPVGEDVLGEGGQGLTVSGDGNLSPGWTYSNGVWGTPTGEIYDMRYLDTGSSKFDLGGFLKSLMPGGSSGGAGNLMGMVGIASLLSKMFGGGGGGYAGYQGGIPKYTASRTQTPMAEQRPTSTRMIEGKQTTIPYRPGQGGITYFTPMTYTAATPAPTSAPAATTEPVSVAGGGIIGAAQRYNLGGYSDGGRLLRGPGDGVSDNIPATIGGRQPARLADGEFVIPARIVSELGNGSTEAGARKLYAMMDRVKRSRMKSKKNIAVDSKADKHLPA